MHPLIHKRICKCGSNRLPSHNGADCYLSTVVSTSWAALELPHPIDPPQTRNLQTRIIADFVAGYSRGVCATQSVYRTISYSVSYKRSLPRRERPGYRYEAILCSPFP